MFITLRRAYETLSNPTTRFAYDRFGPDILDWGLEGSRPDSRTGEKKEVGIREWVMAGLMRSVGFYIFSGGIMVALAGMSSVLVPCSRADGADSHSRRDCAGGLFGKAVLRLAPPSPC